MHTTCKYQPLEGLYSFPLFLKILSNSLFTIPSNSNPSRYPTNRSISLVLCHPHKHHMHRQTLTICHPNIFRGLNTPLFNILWSLPVVTRHPGGIHRHTAAIFSGPVPLVDGGEEEEEEGMATTVVRPPK